MLIRYRSAVKSLDKNILSHLHAVAQFGKVLSPAGHDELHHHQRQVKHFNDEAEFGQLVKRIGIPLYVLDRQTDISVADVNNVKCPASVYVEDTHYEGRAC